jgi:3-phenylpropionate/trans-cinnamate dioxygenase ferredoxin reductase component
MSTTVSAERHNVVIVGAGLAGFHLASALAKQGYPGEVTLVGEEPWQPYDRPPLSKQFQLDGDESQIWLAPELGTTVKLLRQCHARAIDLARQELRLDNGSTLPWDRLVLATGSRARRLPNLGISPRVLTLRTLDDARMIREALQSVASLLVIGGGPIGLELAASAAALGRQSTVVELAPRLMSRSAPAAMADMLLEHHRSQGMAIHLGRTVVALDEGNAEAVLDDGQRVPAGLVVVGIGVQANDALAAQAGIACDDGVFVDGWCRTTAPGVFAVGDVTRQRNPVTGRFERIETWSNAQGQAQALAANWCNPAEARPYDAVPWFWSDQGSARLQCAGALTGEQQAWRVDAAGGRVLVHWSGGRVTGVATLNAARDFVQLKKLIMPRPTITPEQLSAPTANIRALVQQALAARE